MIIVCVCGIVVDQGSAQSNSMTHDERMTSLGKLQPFALILVREFKSQAMTAHITQIWKFRLPVYRLEEDIEQVQLKLTKIKPLLHAAPGLLPFLCVE